MANKKRLRELRADTIINATAKQQEKVLIKALYKVVEYLEDRFVKKITVHCVVCGVDSIECQYLTH